MRDDMKRCVKIKRKDGITIIECRLGLWVVSGPYSDAMREAVRYFEQYKQDGEYEHLLEGGQ